MMNRLKIAFAFFFTAFVIAVPASPTYAQFDFFKDSCKEAPSSTTCQQKIKQQREGENPILGIIRTIANVVAAITGVVAVIMIILGAFNLITSGGNAETVGKGRRRIIFSLVGVAVVALAWTITRLITDSMLQ